MNMPGFSGAASLYKTGRHYRVGVTASSPVARAEAVVSLCAASVPVAKPEAMATTASLPAAAAWVWARSRFIRPLLCAISHFPLRHCVRFPIYVVCLPTATTTATAATRLYCRRQ